MARKATFVLDENLLAQAKQAVESGLFKSLNAFVEITVRDELDRMKKDKIRQAILDASQDPLFLADIKEVENGFKSVDFEVVEKYASDGIFFPLILIPSSTRNKEARDPFSSSARKPTIVSCRLLQSFH
jgi:Arc/MetJ-type ribon-helix-helix transcriptional regulator